ncbi:NHL repeat protein [Rubripirellula tenax]|uniref:NHL repeat protein n=1 Tax=Rubripirellula tenax TaxID=2528015 RepID=A0A5C6F3K5_9BACT|nr:NHL repeat-containing protein [Rubripirellula tenax]TWU54626.1 NHL repeat protein [Rubripirellula tenax]
MKRRSFVGLVAAASVSSFAGCVPSGGSDLPDLVWGRRGLSDGRFLKPRAITIDDDDQLYIVDTTGRIQVFNADGQFLRVWETPETANGRPTGMSFQAARHRGTGSSGTGSSRLLVADTHYYRMLAYARDGELLVEQQIGGTAGHLPGQFAFVTDAVSDDRGNVYIGEYNASDRIQKFDSEGNFLIQWGGTGDTPGKFLRPQSLVIRDDVMWVADACNHRIQRFDLSEETPRLIDVWGGPGTLPGQFYYPYDLALASDGSIIVVEYKNNRIQRLDPDGKPIASWGSPGFEPGMLNQPWGVVVDSQDRVHILDSNNHRVQRIELPA